MKYEEICLYCKSYDIDRQECKKRRSSAKEDDRLKAKVSPRSKPDDMSCKTYHKSDEATYAFGEGGIGYFEENAWSRFKRDQIKKKYAVALGEVL